MAKFGPFCFPQSNGLKQRLMSHSSSITETPDTADYLCSSDARVSLLVFSLNYNKQGYGAKRFSAREILPLAELPRRDSFVPISMKK